MSSKNKNKNEERKLLFKSCCLCCIVFFAFYIILTMLIIRASKNSIDQENDTLDKPRESGITSFDNCTANNYLLQDGVCDEITNTARCLYDGGDCCLDSYKKDTKYCQICTCLGVSGGDYQAIVDDNNMAAFEWETKSLMHLCKIILLIHDVSSGKVCSLLCTNKDIQSSVNSWIYNPLDNSCICSWMEGQLCIETIGKEIDSELLLDPEQFQKVPWMYADLDRVDFNPSCLETILLITGHPFGLSNKTELITYSSDNDNHDTWICEEIPSVPLNIGGATGGTLKDGTVIICGGYKGYRDYFENACYFIKPPSWDILEVAMLSQRYLAASIIVDGTDLYITGGYHHTSFNERVKPLDKTEFVKSDDFPQIGPSMPFGLVNHCMVKIHDQFAFTIGGVQSQTISNIQDIKGSTFMYSIPNSTWTVGPQLTIPREGHSCGALVDEETGSVFVIVVGGFDTDVRALPALDSTEILTLPKDANELSTTWTPGPKLSGPLSYSSMVPVGSGSKLLLIGGIAGPVADYQASIYEWTCAIDTGCQQRLLSSRLTVPRSGFVATHVSVPCQKVSSNDTSDPMKEEFIRRSHCNDRVGDLDHDFVTRHFCCHGGNLCESGHGACLRDSDCQGSLVCGCNNCNTLSGPFAIDQGCCTTSKDTCDTNHLTTAKPQGFFCNTTEDCHGDQICLGGCLMFQQVIDTKQTCCADASVPDVPCCNGSLTVSIEGIECPGYQFNGIFVQFSPSRSGSWIYIQLGNYDTILRQGYYGSGDFWQIWPGSDKNPHYDAVTADMPDKCPGHQGQLAHWTCQYRHTGQSGQQNNEEFTDGGISKIQCGQ